MAPREVENPAERGTGEHGTRGVVGRVEEDGLGTRGDRGADVLDAIGKTILGAQSHPGRNAAGEANVLRDFRPHRIGDDDFVADVEEGAKGDVERVHGAVGDEDVVGGDAR